MKSTRRDHDMSLHLCHRHGLVLTADEKSSLNSIASSYACNENWAGGTDFKRLREAEMKCDCAKR